MCNRFCRQNEMFILRLLNAAYAGTQWAVYFSEVNRCGMRVGIL